MSLVCQGWCQAKRGALVPGIEQMKEGLELWAMTGFENWQALFATYLSDAYVLAGSLDEAERLLDTHDARVARFGEDQFKPPLAASRANLLSARGDVGGAVRAAQSAREWALRNRATLWLRP
jgi:predicted ATPase